MKDIKTWLDTNYPADQRKNIIDLYLSDENLEGNLNLVWAEFPKLERVWYHHQLKIVSNYCLTLAAILQQKSPTGLFVQTNLHVETKKYIPAQDILDKLYSKLSRTGIVNLDLTQKGLRGKLDLSDFTNIKKLTLNLDCPWGRKYANSNYITELNLTKNTKLTELTLTNNQLERKLSDLAHLTNLKKLVLRGNSYENPSCWTGSLELLKNLKELEELDISYNPAVEQGLENLEKVKKLEAKETIYEKQLKSFGGDVMAWKVIVFPEKVSNDKNTIIQKINEYLNETQENLNLLNQKQLTNLDLENKIIILETRNRELLK